MPTVSIIVPSFNHSQFLDRRLGSILQQTFTDFEVIFLDDASTDNSKDVFQKYANHQKIKSKFYSVNSGSPFVQWNRGIGMSQGDYIWIAESDDFSDIHFLEIMIGTLERHPAAALAYCESQIVRDDGELVSFLDYYGRLPMAERWSDNYYSNGSNELAQYLVFQNTIPNASAVLFRKNPPGGLPVAPEHMRLGGDWMFWCKLAAQGDVCYVAKPLNYFRDVHNQSQRARTARQALEVLEGLEVFEFIISQVDLPPDTRSQVLRRQIWVWANMAFQHRLEPGVGKKIRRQLIRLHPQISKTSFWHISLPFIFFYVKAALKSVPFVVLPYRKARQGFRWILSRFKKNESGA